MKKLNILSFTLFILLLTPVISCKQKAKSAEDKKVETLADDIVELRDDQIKLANIVTGSIEMRSLSGILKVNGVVTVAPQNFASVSAPLGGYVSKTTLMPGNPVVKGQLLAILENKEFIDIQQDYLEAKNKLGYAQSEMTRHTELYKNDVYSQMNMEQVTTDYKGLMTQVKALEQKLSLVGIDPAKVSENNISRSVEVLSPLSGYVKSVNVNIGKFVSPSDVMFEIVNDDKLYLELTLFEKDATQTAVGQKIHFTINNETEQHEAYVVQTGKTINSDKTCSVYASVNGKCKNLIPGMYVSAFVETASSQLASLPTEAIVNFEDKDYIFAFVKNKTENGKPFTEYRMLQVKKGVTDGGYSEVILPDGIDATKIKIVVKGAYSLLSAKKNAGEMSC
ncbi:MAG: efflux RND transporter periplasmic adaptor subunit [Bacteroidetes bacterium]|nr:efflux RND transporter periplasmic adaptor subunit [Bacteroidota bacterium]